MTDDRQLAKPVEELARALLGDWQRSVKSHYRLVAMGHALGPFGEAPVAAAFRQARTAIDTLRALGMINEIGLEAIKAEEREVGN